MNYEITIDKNEHQLIHIPNNNEYEATYIITLNGQGANVEVIGLFAGHKSESFNYKIRIIHQTEETTSNIDIKSVLKNKASLQIDSLITVQRQSKRSNARFSSNTIMLSEKAKCEIRPNIEMKNNESKGNHKAVIKNVSKDDLFYLASRGLDKEQAEDLIVKHYFKTTHS